MPHWGRGRLARGQFGTNCLSMQCFHHQGFRLVRPDESGRPR